LPWSRSTKEWSIPISAIRNVQINNQAETAALYGLSLLHYEFQA